MMDFLADGTVARLRKAGLSVCPAYPMGDEREKAPALQTWTELQNRLPSEAEIKSWHWKGRMIGLFCGQVSGGLEALDLDIPTKKDPGFVPGSVPPPLHQPWLDLVKDHGAEDLVKRLVLERSPSGGLHYYWRCSSIRKKGDANKKLAHIVLGKSSDGREIYKDCIELQSSGFFVVCHPSPGYELLQGSLEAIPEITPEERDLLLSMARRLDRKPPDIVRTPQYQKAPMGQGEVLPGEDFNTRGTWEEVIPEWTFLNSHWRGLREVRRPGKTMGSSGVIGQGDMGDHIVVWTDGTDLEPWKGYTKFSAFTVLHHRGDYSAAAAALSAKGYGQRRSKMDSIPSSTQEGHAIDDMEPQGLQPYTIDQWRRDLSEVTAGRKSGYSNLDKLAMIPEGAITIVAGRPNMGKTTMLLNVLHGMEGQDQKPGSYLFFSYEESNKILLAKLLMLMTGKVFDASKNLGQYLGRVRDGWEDGLDPDLDKAYKKLQQLTDSGRIIFVDHPYRVEKLFDIIEETAAVQPVRAVFLDYIQKIRPQGSGQARYLDVAYASETIRGLAVKHNLPFIVGAQLGRPEKKSSGDNKKGLSLDNLRESGDLEQDANLVLALHRDSVHRAEGSEEGMIAKYSTSPEDHEEDMEVHVLKHRNGPTGKLTMSFIGPIYKIKEKSRSL